MMNFIKRGFEDLFTTSKSLSHSTTSPSSRWQTYLSGQDYESLITPISEEDIKAVLWSMKAFKSPGLNGLHAGFFQQFWPTVGPKVVQEVKKIFFSKKVPDYLNRTLISLIPKS